MPIFDIFSLRKKRATQAGASDVYQYDELPEALRVQVAHMWDDAFTAAYRGDLPERTIFRVVHDLLCREYGRFQLTDNILARNSYTLQCRAFLLAAPTAEALDVIEATFRIPWLDAQRDMLPFHLRDGHFEELVDELNSRFREAGVGYQFESGEIVRVDSKLVHAEVVKPALALLLAEGFEGADAEFRNAFEHYRHGRHKEALVDALKSFESTMKTICKRKKWEHPEGATASKLIATIFEKGLIHQSLQTHFSGLRQTLEAGVPTVRNKLGGHGQGEAPVEVPGYLAAYALHLTATNLVMLLEAFKASR